MIGQNLIIKRINGFKFMLFDLLNSNNNSFFLLFDMIKLEMYYLIKVQLVKKRFLNMNNIKNEK